MYDRQTGMAIGSGSPGFTEGACTPPESSIGQQTKAKVRAEAERQFNLSTPVAQRGELATALEAQEKATHELMEVVRHLGSRLSPVLSSRPDDPTGKEADCAFSSAAASCAHENTKRIRLATAMVSALIRDLAL